MQPLGGVVSSLQDQSASPESLDAMTVLDTHTNVAAVAAQRKKDAAEDAAKAPTPEIKTRTINGNTFVDAKNLPAVSPQDQVKSAEAEPFAQYAESIRQSLGQAARVKGQIADPESPDIDQKMQTPEGRKALALEIGVQPPEMEWKGGLLGTALDYAGKSDRYDRAVNATSAARLRSAVMQARLAARANIDKENAPAFKELSSVALQQARDQREARAKEAEQRHAEEDSVRQTMDSIHTMDLTGFKSPDDAVSTMSKLFPEAAKREGFADAVTASHHAQSLALQRKNLEVQIQQSREANDTKKTNALLSHLATVDANIGQIMGVRAEANQHLSQDDIANRVQLENSSLDKSQLPKLTGPQQLQVARYRAATNNELAPALRPQAADALAKNGAVRETTAELRSALEPFRDSPYWNMPFDQLPNRIKYQLGMASADQLGKLQSKFQIESWAGTMALVRGMRNGQIIQEVRQHLPVFGKDSMALMDDKLANADSYYQSNEDAIKKFGAKSGVVTKPAGGGNVSAEGQSILDDLRRKYPNGGKKP
jgi:hypothetical protein